MIPPYREQIRVSSTEWLQIEVLPALESSGVMSAGIFIGSSWVSNERSMIHLIRKRVGYKDEEVNINDTDPWKYYSLWPVKNCDVAGEIEKIKKRLPEIMDRHLKTIKSVPIFRVNITEVTE